MNMDERNAVLAEFKSETDILISTDAGGEGLNLQFSNCVINYDLPWNPMKIEQRIGRVDRIGQQRDVEVFNFVLADTVENRVKDVLEEKLSIILKEIGIDKYSDVLDSESAGINFTDAYMNSIRNPKDISYNIKPIEEDLKKEVQNTVKLKELLKDEKDLDALVGRESTFDFESALREMVTYFENYKGNPYLPVHNFSINDEIIVNHLRKQIVQDVHNGIQSIDIADFTNEKGYFMLWELSVSSERQDQKIIPIFMNEDKVFRPMAGPKIWEAILSNKHRIYANGRKTVEKELFDTVRTISQEYAYDTFMHLKSEMEKRIEETHRKYQYALKLRTEAAEHIGIENIRKHKLKSLGMEKVEMEQLYMNSKMICPEFNLMIMVHLE